MRARLRRRQVAEAWGHQGDRDRGGCHCGRLLSVERLQAVADRLEPALRHGEGRRVAARRPRICGSEVELPSRPPRPEASSVHLDVLDPVDRRAAGPPIRGQPGPPPLTRNLLRMRKFVGSSRGPLRRRSGVPRRANPHAHAMTGIETANLSARNPEAYLADLLGRIREHDQARLDDLLP
jgi:hypothetical protein